ncbi:hypothetical protein BGZ96_000747 [Linnemannia gamsii]|uniref:Uncharacterized protein n=1 Tax=Linnemannia gamsii TaxID=64522 RepID=A0ABQ7JP36_9FUNG|nr:hypothetical protein BGZ96_000747 [Linnemannia gamsii]
MSTPPVAIDPAHIPPFLTSTIPGYPQDSPFLGAFHSLHPPNAKEFPVRFYIVQQPAPARHRRSFVHRKDLRVLFGRNSSSCTDGAKEGNSDLKDTVLIMKRIHDELPGDPLLTAGTLASFQSAYGLESVAGSGTSASGDSMRGDRSINGGDDTSSSFGGDDDMPGGNVNNFGGMSKTWIGADVASWMENNAQTYLNMCLSMGHEAHLDQSDTASPPSDTVSNLPTTAQLIPEENDSESDGIFDDNDEDDYNDEESRGGKRSRHSTNTNAQLDPNQTLPQHFRPLKKDGEIQFEIWIVAFFKPQLLPAFSAKAIADEEQQKKHSQLCSEWTGTVNALLDSVELQQFVRAEVSGGRIGIDFKDIMAKKKDNRKSTRRVIR